MIQPGHVHADASVNIANVIILCLLNLIISIPRGHGPPYLDKTAQQG